MYKRIYRYSTIVFSILAVLSLVFLSGCGSSNSSNNNTTDGTTGVRTDKVSISNFAFNPSTIIVTAGTTVTWTNQDSTAHTVVSGNGTFKSGSLNQGQSFQFKFDTKGTYNYTCGIHPSMQGSVTVE